MFATEEIDDVRASCGMHDANETGRGVRVAVLDTGASHPVLTGVIEAATSCDLVRSPGTHSLGADVDGHGTQIAGLLAAPPRTGAGWLGGVAPGIDLCVIRIAESRTDIPFAAVARGIQHAIRVRADLIVLALGAVAKWFKLDVPPPWVWSWIPALDEALDAAEAAGVLCVAAAGNDEHPNAPREGTVVPPAGRSSVLAVGAATSHGVPTHFSARGPYRYVERQDRLTAGTYLPWNYLRSRDRPIEATKPDVLAFGTHIACPTLAGEAGSELVAAGPLPAGYYGLRLGTSHACAVAAGLIACGIELARAERPDLLGAGNLNRLRDAIRAGGFVHGQPRVAGRHYPPLLHWNALQAAVRGAPAP